MFLCRQNPPPFAFKIQIAPRSLKCPHVSISQRLSNSLLCHYPWLYPFPPSLTSLRSCLYFSLFASACFWVCWAKKGGVEPQAIQIPRVRVSPILRNSKSFFLIPEFRDRRLTLLDRITVVFAGFSPSDRPCFCKIWSRFPPGFTISLFSNRICFRSYISLTVVEVTGFLSCFCNFLR